MNAVTDDIIRLAEKELESANKKFPPFNSPHEGWAIILEESQEAQVEMSVIEDLIGSMWINVMQNQKSVDLVMQLYTHATELAAEAIQVAAMSLKYLKMEEKNHE